MVKCNIKCNDCGTVAPCNTFGWKLVCKETPNQFGRITREFYHLCPVCKQTQTVN